MTALAVLVNFATTLVLVGGAWGAFNLFRRVADAAIAGMLTITSFLAAAIVASEALSWFGSYSLAALRAGVWLSSVGLIA